jgi:outer membrane protein OmpA-like peptidoglycan-associated protein
VVLGVDEVLFATAWGDVAIRVERISQKTALTAAERRLANRTVLELRRGLELRDSSALEVAQRLKRGLSGPGGLHFHAVSAPSSSAEGRSLDWQLEHAFASGRLRPKLLTVDSLEPRALEIVPPLPPVKPVRESPETFFEVRLTDEIGQGIPGVGVEFAFDGTVQEVTTNAAGVALLEGVKSGSASAAVPDGAALEKVLDPRWQQPRKGTRKKESNTTEVLFQGAGVAPLGIKPAVPNTVVLLPPLGALFLELFDKTGRVRHVQREYTLEGPQTFSGTTDENGRLQHENVFPGDYTLKLTLKFFEGADEQVDRYESPLVVLRPAASDPEVRLIGAVPFSVLARLRFFFNTNKAFLLPTALPGIRKLRALYLENNPSELLVVGHADTSGGAAFNDELSLERAKSTIAFLKDDVDVWLGFYGSGVPQKKRWGAAEDRMMLVALPDFTTKPKGEDAVRWFQRTRKLQVDGTAGPETRRQLVTEYMALDGTSLSQNGVTINATPHGCGEFFPLDTSGEGLDAAPADAKRDPIDRRVELFFFDPEFGVVPRPPGDNSTSGSTQYPAWRKSAIEEHDIGAGAGDGFRVTFIELVDALFRTNSAVVLPEGEAPGSTVSHPAFTAAGMVATALRFNEEHPGKRILVAGHTDTTANADFNQKLSDERAQCALAILSGGSEQREAFKSLCDGRHTVSDYKQILSWVSRAFADLAFDCDPGAIDENPATATEPVRRFQKAYNANKASLGATAPDLAVDGVVGPLTWGAFFDCYELALQQELGEDAAGLQALRDALRFADEDRRALGFSEHFPIEELGVDEFESQSNRRVELLFFDEGEEPDLVAAESDPETAELYLPGVYVRAALKSASSARRNLRTRLLIGGKPFANEPFRLLASNTVVFSGATSEEGVLAGHVPQEATEIVVEFAQGLKLTLPVRTIEPIESNAGVQRRLAHLGFFHGEVDGEQSPALETAIREFQAQHALDATGALDPPTTLKIREVYGG